MDDRFDHLFSAFKEKEVQASSVEYEERVVMFIDILGFGSLIDSTGVDGTAGQENLEKIIGCFNRALSDIYDLSNPEYIQFSHFSDSFVISHWTYDPDDIDSMFHCYLTVLMIAKSIINAFLEQDILVRGGITQGRIFHKEGYLLLGPAMNEAYYLESKRARYPRIILSEKIINRIEKKLGPLPSAMLNVLGISLEVDDDNEIYINYFDACGPGILNAFPTDNPSLKEKYEWLKRKLNQ